MNTTRRHFIVSATASGASMAFASQARAQAKLDEKDPQALALGYVADAVRVDAKKYAKYATGQNCASCALYQGKPGDTAGNCPLYAGKQVNAKAWCSAWVKKA